MSGLLKPNQELGFVRDTAELERQLVKGDGIQWPGDPDLYLAQGIVEETNYGRPTGKIVARRWEVWRHCEDGIERIIGHWRMEEFDRIIFDLARMRAESSGHEDVIDRIDAGNVKAEEKIWAPGRDKLAEMMEHMAKLHHDRNNPRNVFRGIPGQNPDKQL